MLSPWQAVQLTGLATCMLEALGLNYTLLSGVPKQRAQEVGS